MAAQRIEARWRIRLHLVLFTLLLTAGMGFILAYDLLLTRRVNIEAGQAADEDIAAPRRIEFESKIRTEAARKQAVSAVGPVYDPLDRQVGREQVNLAQRILDFIDSVRSDPYATPEYQRYCLESIESVHLSPQVISNTLQLSADEWKAVQLETRRVLAEVMQEEIKSGQEDIYRRNVRALVSFELNEAQTSIVEEIVKGLIKANRVYNAQATEAARRAAMESVKPQMRVLEKNEIIVRSGEIVDEEDIEALDALGLRNPQVNWLGVGGAFLFAMLLSVFTAAYLRTVEYELLTRPHHLLLLLLLLILFTFLCKWGATPTVTQLQVVPLATLGMLVTALFNPRLGLVVHMLICLVVGYVAQGRMDLILYTLSGGLVGIFTLRRVNRINTFVWAGAYVMVSNVAIVILFALIGGQIETLQVGRAILRSIVNGGFAAVLTLGGYYLLGMMFNITTTLQLLDLARPTHPLMHQLLLKAPGTYHHSIMVGNMAEQAAEAIGANALLARVGAYYHDIGKIVRPYFFSENQMDGSNPHDLLDPETSAQIIRSHTRDGLALARKYHLPAVIRAFIAEHHGTGKMSYFYHKAVQEYGEENVREQDYKHLGPRPQSKETAIVMMADSCEAAVRSVRPTDAEALEKLVRRIISNIISSGQLNDAPLTLREIETITTSFINTLQGVFHPRVRYPGDEKSSRPSVEQADQDTGGSDESGADRSGV